MLFSYKGVSSFADSVPDVGFSVCICILFCFMKVALICLYMRIYVYLFIYLLACLFIA